MHKLCENCTENFIVRQWCNPSLCGITDEDTCSSSLSYESDVVSGDWIEDEDGNRFYQPTWERNEKNN